MNIIKKILVTVVALVFFIGLAGFFILPTALKPFLIQKISDTLHREASIDQIKINPFALSITILGFRLADPGQTTPWIAFDELYLNADALTSIFRRAFILEEIRLDHPYVGLTRNLDGTYNFSDLIPPDSAKKETPAKPFLFSLNNIQITGGKIDFRDLPRKTDHTVRELQLAIPFVSNIEHYLKNYVEPKFSAVINGQSVAITGRTQPFLTSRDTRFDIDLKDIDVPFYLQYAPVQMNFKLTQARLDAAIQLHFIMPPDQAPKLKLTGRTSLRKVAIDDLQGNKILRLPALTVHLASVDPFVPSIHLDQITLDAPQLIIRRDRKGDINLQNLIGTNRKDEQAKLPAAQTIPDDRSEKKKDLSLLIDHFLIDKADITFIDVQPSQPVKIQIHPLRLSTSKLSLKKGDKADVDLVLVIDQKSAIRAKGSFGMEPLTADLALEMTNLAIRPFQPYFTDSVRVDVTRGSIATAGSFSLKLDAQNKPSIKYQGHLAVSQLTAIDRARAHDFLKFRQLGFSSFAAGYNPLFVNIGEISLNDFFVKMVIHDDGSTNIQDIFGAPAKETRKTVTQPLRDVPDANQTPPPEIKIGKVSLSGGSVEFTDRNIKPNYQANMLNLKGSVTGLSSQEITRAKVDLKANLGYGSPIEIRGTVNPLIKDLFADIRISFKDLEMSTVTPYAGRYLGYPITKGKLHFNVSYLIDKRKLTAENKVFFDQLTFGEKMESPDAIAAPVTLAVSLLTDRHGQINLDLPVSGSLDDPTFKFWPIVWQILVNLITKAVTSPFALLGSLTGGGEEMSFVEFDFGSAALSEAGEKKISALAKILYDRPKLKLEIEAYVDRDDDKGALKRAEVNRLIKLQKLKDMVDKGQAPLPLADISILPSEYEQYLTLAYKAYDFPKPRADAGGSQTLPPLEMAKRIHESIAVTDGDLTLLANRRAQIVREQLLKAGQIEPARIFLVKALSLTPDKKEKVKDSRVVFKLK